MNTVETNPRLAFKGEVIGNPSEIFTKSNGGEYVLQNVKINDGALTGITVGATRTIKNKDGKVKEAIAVGTEVTVYLTQVPSTTEPGKMKNFFDISMNNTASDDDINALLQGANLQVAQEAVATQTV